MADIFSDIFKFAGTVINQALTPDNLRDYRHASKLFVDDQYRLMPKLGFLFYVRFDINDVRFPDPQNPLADREIGMLVKSVSLPKFSIDVKKYNSYNRPNYVQSKINYDPISITFHDDSANVIRNFWFDYYNYYYRDADYTEELYSAEHKYEKERRSDKWGYSPRLSSGKPYLRSIRIYSLHQKRFSEYVLLNPMIKTFRHGDHQQGQNETVQHDMTVEYESVLYLYGSVTPSNVPGFADLHYDKMPSPLTPAGGGTKSILGPGGLLDTADDVVQDVKDGNYGSALFKGLKGLKTAKSMNLKKAAIGEVLELGKGVLRGNNPQNNIFVPSLTASAQTATDSGGQISGGGALGIGSGTSWLAGGAVLGLSIFGNSKSNREEVTDAAISRNDSQSPNTAVDGLPAPEGTESTTTGTAKPVTQTAINSYGSDLDLKSQIKSINDKINDIQKQEAENTNQVQKAEDAIDFFSYRRDTLISEGKLAEARELNSLIEQQNQIISSSNAKKSALLEEKEQYNRTLSQKQYELNLLS